MTDRASMPVAPDVAELELALEAVLFAASEPVPVKDLLAACSTVDAGAPARADLDAALERLAGHYRDRSIELVQSAGGYRFRVRQRFSAQVQAAQPERPPRLSRALLETLAIIAYRQPVTRAEIEDIRGVAVSTQIMRTLTEREWVHIVGHKEVPGRPGLYATTRTFLDDLGLGRLDELPPLDDLRELVDLPPDTADFPRPASSAPQEVEEGSPANPQS
ncbi:SMC-Scp complex subunit ScpB [Thioalkalivibrio sp.]|uniref:SMC-Scp complex subunit ScpB n=1 Tax=Thioalkalivibrio sp. TaxID=2093813 RepID=UPI0039759104